MTTDSRPVVTRFAPSPTGFLHIGGARTALFNWLFARHHGGSFRLRIEDTDRKRSTQEAIDAILDGLDWLGLDHDGEIVHQFSRAERHAAMARGLLAQGRAYHCYCSPEELEEMRASARAEGRPMRYDGRWRDRDPSEAPAGVDPVVRLKMPQDGETTIADLVQGPVTVRNDQLDDMVLLRADGTPTYMLSVVVDDHDMDVTHVIRGDDHLTNTFRQYQLYRALDWEAPAFAHIPLIHGPDGAKLSKRHGALGVDAYRDMGYLPEALREGRPAAITGMDGLKARAKNLVELAESAAFYAIERPLPMNAKAEKILTPEARRRLAGLQAALAALPEWNEAAIEEAVRVFAGSENCKLGDAAQPLRAALTGSNVSPGIFEVMAVLGREESLARIADQSAAA